MSTSPVGNEEGLSGYWNFNSDTGTNLIDETSNSNNGTISGATWSSECGVAAEAEDSTLTEAACNSIDFDGKD